jgi:hypothetical protein
MALRDGKRKKYNEDYDSDDEMREVMQDTNNMPM